MEEEIVVVAVIQQFRQAAAAGLNSTVPDSGPLLNGELTPQLANALEVLALSGPHCPGPLLEAVYAWRAAALKCVILFC